MIFKIDKKRSGFTMVELIVAMSVFIIAITIAVGSFVRVIRTQRIVNHLMGINSDASLTIEQIAREIRTGHSFEIKDFPVSNPVCENRVAGQKDELTFTNFKNKSITYHSVSKVFMRRECPIEGSAPNCNGVSFFPMTASNILVNYLCFQKIQVNGNDPWRITIFSGFGSTNPDLAGNILNIQTTVSSRILPDDLLP